MLSGFVLTFFRLTQMCSMMMEERKRKVRNVTSGLHVNFFPADPTFSSANMHTQKVALIFFNLGDIGEDEQGDEIGGLLEIFNLEKS